MLTEKINSSLLHFDPIDLIEMDRVKLMNRVDTKFAFSVTALFEIISALQSDYSILEIENTRCPLYESLYLDDANFTFFKDHHNGRANRFKVRFRKYVESNLTFLEIKQKIKGRTHKRRIKVDRIPTSMRTEHADFIRSILKSERDFLPVIWNSFNRMTFVHKKENERLTLDFNVSFKWENSTHTFENLVIAELKQENISRNSTFFQLMKQLQIRPYRLSKYCIGSIQIYGNKHFKYNNFKKKLIQLQKINSHAA